MGLQKSQIQLGHWLPTSSDIGHHRGLLCLLTNLSQGAPYIVMATSRVVLRRLAAVVTLCFAVGGSLPGIKLLQQGFVFVKLSDI